jgi:hypothetical protein
MNIMNILLLIITALSLAAAFVAALSVRKLKRADQQRSEARVTALVAAADAIPVHLEPQAMPRAAASTDGVWSSVAGEWQWQPEAMAEHSGGTRMFPAESNMRLKPETTGNDASAGDDNLFGTVRREPPASLRFAFAAALALVVAVGGAAIVFTTSNHVKAAPSRSAGANPLELVSLGHSHDARSLTINGVVRNPANGPKLEGLTAVVSLIDEHGGLISSKDVPLDYRALGPGEEAPFRVTVPDQGSIARYRVSFRAGTDVVPHVDRRTDAKLASTL